MREELRKKEEQYKVYIAEDGTEFENGKQCRLYEDTARCVICAKLDIKRVNAWHLCFGYDENEVEIIDGNLDDIKMYLALVKSACCTNEVKNTIDEIIKSKSKKKSKLLIFRNCEDEIYNIIWQHELIEKINNECKNEEEQKEPNSDQL